MLLISAYKYIIGHESSLRSINAGQIIQCMQGIWSDPIEVLRREEGGNQSIKEDEAI